MIKYAEVWPVDAGEAVTGFRHAEHTIAAADIKHVGGRPVLRPVAVVDYDRPGFDPDLEDRLAADLIIERERVVEGYVYRWRPDVKAVLKARVDAEAEQARLLVMTPGFGQSLVYQRKAQEASAALAAVAQGQNPDPADYPLLAAEVGLSAPTLAEVAALVQAAADRWLAAVAGIETMRLARKKAIDDAPDEAAAVAAWRDGL